MRTLLAILFFSPFLLSAELCSSDNLLSTKTIDNFSNSIGAVVYENGELNGCSWDEQLSYYSSLKRVVDRLNKTLKQGENYDFSKVKGKSRRMAKRALRRLQCMKEKSEEMGFRCVSRKECKPGKEAVAYVEWNDVEFLGVKMKRVYPEKMINVCAGKLKSYPHEAFRDAIVAHELSHHCGAEDLDTFVKVYTWRMPSAYLIDDWDRNADMYAYWYLNPFCVPGVDCDGHFFSED